jgi:hypothetical protein
MADQAENIFTAATLPPELLPESAAIRRKQRLAEVLMAKGLQPSQGFMAGRMFIPVSGLQVLASGLNAGTGAWLDTSVEKDQEDLAKKYKSLLSEEVNRYIDSTQPRKVSVPDVGGMTGSMDEQDAPTRTEVLPPAPSRERIVKAMTSGFAPMRQLGQMELQSLLKGGMTPKDWADVMAKMTPESVREAMMTGDMTRLRLLPEYSASEGFVINKRDPFGGSGPQPISRWSPPQEAPGNRGIMYQEQQGTGRINWGPSTTNVTQTNVPEDKANLAVTHSRLKVDEKVLEDSAQAARSAVSDLHTIVKAHGYLEQGAKAGMYRDLKTAVSQITSELGLRSEDPTVTPTRLLVAALQERVLKNSRALGSGTAFSNTDREYLEKMLTGKDMPLEGLYQLLAHVAIDTTRVINDHNALVQQAAQVKGTPEGWQAMHTLRIPEFKLYEAPPAIRPEAFGGRPVGR